MLQKESFRARSRGLIAGSIALMMAGGGFAAEAWAAAPQASVSVTADVDMVYRWSIAAKALAPSLGTVRGGAQLTSEYTVEVVPADYGYNKAVLAGMISVANPGEEAMEVTVKVASSDAAWACQTDTPQQSIPAGGSKAIAYDCILSGDAEPHLEGSVDASISWNSGDASDTATASASYTINPRETNRSITIESILDGANTKRLGTLQWAPGGKSTTLKDTRSFTASKKPGSHQVINVARIAGSGEQASAAVTYIVEEDTASPTPSPSASPSPDDASAAPSSPSDAQSPTRGSKTAHSTRPSPGMPPTGI